jgi:molybdopterin/thiamine biosynthesis adenylyltransferase
MPTDHKDQLQRYSRQVLFAPIGEEGQRRIRRSRVALIGCGALGNVVASMLVRAGVGFLRICDSDEIELNNLQRQSLFDEEDIRRGLPKAVAAAKKLRLANSEVEVEPVVADVSFRNIERFVEGAHLICDGTDNFETRYLINDVAIRRGVPWVYNAVLGASGLVMPVLPGKTPCLRCVFDAPPPPDVSPTCDTAGVIAPAVGIVASWQVVEALKILTGKLDEVTRGLMNVDAWAGRVVTVRTARAHDGRGCICCGDQRFEYLDGKIGGDAAILCGRNAVQIQPSAPKAAIDFDRLADRLAAVATSPIRCTSYMLTARIGAHELTLFPDGRAIIKGTDSPEEARTIYAKYIGG